MIVVDTSVWIDFLNGVPTPEVERFKRMLGTGAVLLGDLVLCEIMQGLRDERRTASVGKTLEVFRVVPMVGPTIARKAAANYRLLRGRGVAVRKTIDLLIGTFCVENGHRLLHDDRDFRPMADHLGLELA